MSSYTPLGWHESISSVEYVNHISAEYARLGFATEAVPFRLEGIWHELLTGSVNTSALAFLISSGTLDLKRHVERVKGTTLGQPYGPKPSAKCRFNITKRDNLAVVWHPTGVLGDSGDWFREPLTSPLSRGRAENELVFLRRITDLYPRRGDLDAKLPGGLTLADGNFMISDLICCARMRVAETLSAIECAVNLDVLNRFEFELSTDRARGTIFPVVLSWRIVASADRVPHF